MTDGTILHAMVWMLSLLVLNLPLRAALPLDEADRDAIRMYREAVEALWEAREERIDDDTRSELRVTDRFRSGLVGVEWSRLTTTPGYLTAKRTSAHPLWVAVFRAWFRELDLQPGDRVAIGASGSFPGFLLAARLAAESMELVPVVVGSLTSSNFGGNVEAFDLWHMENVLLAGGHLNTPMRGFTPGGNRDRVARADEETVEHVMGRLETIRALDPQTEMFVPESGRESFDWRIRLFFEEGRALAFINIGGHAINYGSGARILELPAGLIRPDDVSVYEDESLSIILHALNRGIPVLHLLNVRGLAEQWDVPLNPMTLDVPGLNDNPDGDRVKP